MKKIWSILKFTYLQNVKTKSFIISTLITIILIGGFVNFNNIKTFFQNKFNSEESVDKVVFYDKDNLIGVTEEEINKAVPEDFKVEVIKNSNEVEDIKEKIKNKDDDYRALITASSKDIKNIEMYTNYGPSSQNVALINSMVQSMYLKLKASELNIKNENINYLKSEIPLNIVQADEKAKNNFALVYVMIFVLYSLIIGFGSVILNSVIEEKSNRIMETLITMAKPSQLFFGKILAVCGVCLTSLLCNVGAFVIFTKINGQEIPFISMESLNASKSMILLFIIFATLGYFIFALIYGALGSLADNPQDGAQAAMPMTFVVIGVFMAAMYILNDPDSLLAKVLSFIPFSSPMIMFERIGLSEVPWYEVLISIAILILTIILIGIFSVKVYKKGVLRYGKKVSLFKTLKK